MTQTVNTCELRPRGDQVLFALYVSAKLIAAGTPAHDASPCRAIVHGSQERWRNSISSLPNQQNIRLPVRFISQDEKYRQELKFLIRQPAIETLSFLLPIVRNITANLSAANKPSP